MIRKTIFAIATVAAIGAAALIPTAASAGGGGKGGGGMGNHDHGHGHWGGGFGGGVVVVAPGCGRWVPCVGKVRVGNCARDRLVRPYAESPVLSHEIGGF